ncbi:hybrid sensor histidine kinase/response regulator, partial [Pseudomonas aeruginosa]
TAGEYSSQLQIPAPDRPEGADAVVEAPLHQAADGLRSPSPSSLVFGLLVACLVCVGCLGWNTVLQLRLRRWQRTEADLSGRLALKQAL